VASIYVAHQISAYIMKLVLRSLSCSRPPCLLLKDPPEKRSIEMSDVFRINQAFTSPKSYIVVQFSLPRSMKLSRTRSLRAPGMQRWVLRLPQGAQLRVARNFGLEMACSCSYFGAQIEATIVRVMKSRKRMFFNALSAEARCVHFSGVSVQLASAASICNIWRLVLFSRMELNSLAGAVCAGRPSAGRTFRAADATVEGAG
jgi:hypothetical protein